MGSPIKLSDEEKIVISSESTTEGGRKYKTTSYGELTGELGGLCQEKNTNTILTAIEVLKKAGYSLTEEDIRHGFAHVSQLTGLMGRWQRLNEHPLLICDTGHNVGGISYIVDQLKQQTFEHLHIVMGMVNDKDVSGVLAMMPHNATYYFTKASVKRALNEEELQNLAQKYGLTGNCYPNVADATSAALKNATPNDLIFVGGSSFIVADLLSMKDEIHLPTHKSKEEKL